MKNMKYIAVILLLLLYGCKEEYIGQYPIDDIAPQSVSDPVIENLEGKVKITYKLPNETDVLYVKAVYKNTLGETKEVKSSIFKNELEIQGFGKSKKQIIQLITVDRSQNMSVPVAVEIEPLNSPIYTAFESLKASPSWGGFLMTWNNPQKEQFVVKVNVESKDGWADLETFYSKDIEGKGAVRGLDTIPYNFRIFIKDVYENCSDTLLTEIVPLYEIQVPSDKFKLLPLAPGYTYSQWQKGTDPLWDGILNSESSMFYIAHGETKNPYFTLDLGDVYLLSRTRLWQRTMYAYTLHNSRFFEFWGTTDIEAVKDPANWEGWNRLLECESIKPSGPGATVTGDDQTAAMAGEEYEFPNDVIPVRYIRFKSLQSWTKTNGICLGELRFWGKLSDRVE